MKVKLLRNPAAALCCDLLEGQTGTVDNLTGKRLVESGIALDISEPKPKQSPQKIETVPPVPTIAEPKPAAIKAPAKVKPPASEADNPKKSAPTRGGQNPKDEKESLI